MASFPKFPRKLILVRHAETILNDRKKGRVFFSNDEERRGIENTPDHALSLSEKGLEQSKALGQFIWERYGVPHYVVTSGFRRTQQTLDGILAAYPDKQIQIAQDINLRERDVGATDRMTEEEVNRYFPWLQRYWDLAGPFLASPPSGESIANMLPRIQLALTNAFTVAEKKTLLLIVHARVIACCRYLLEDWDIPRMEAFLKGPSPRNGGCTLYSHLEGRLSLEEYNHIPESFDNV